MERLEVVAEAVAAAGVVAAAETVAVAETAAVADVEGVVEEAVEVAVIETYQSNRNNSDVDIIYASLL